MEKLDKFHQLMNEYNKFLRLCREYVLPLNSTEKILMNFDEFKEIHQKLQHKAREIEEYFSKEKENLPARIETQVIIIKDRCEHQQKLFDDHQRFYDKLLKLS